MLELIVNPGQIDERTYVLPQSAIVGRANDAAVAVLHRSLSRHHARLVCVDGAWSIEDLGSKNGTWVNGVRVETRTTVRAGDKLRCGDVHFNLVEANPTAPRPTIVRDVQPSVLSSMLLPARGRSGSAINLRTDAGHPERVSLKGELLLEVARVLAEPDDEVVVSKIVDLLFQIFDIDRAAVLLRDRSGRVGVRKARARDDAAPMSDRLHSQSIVEFVMTQGLAAVFADARHDQRLGGAESVMLQSIQSSMGAPLRARENVFGALYVDNVQTTDRFTPEDLDYLVAFANQAAVAIDNARMAKELERAAVVRANLSRFFSPAIAQQILTTGGDQLPTTRTFVTALFCDISDYTEIASGMDPLEVVSMLNRYFPTVADVVFAHGGMLEKYIGDAILAVWGAPYPQPDDADRAVAAAVEIRKAVAAMNLRPDRRHPPISVHIGLCSGPVAAGNVGSDAYVQYATIGDATNVAARVSASARAGEIRIAEATWDRLRERPAADVIEGVLLKGKEGTHRVYRLT